MEISIFGYKVSVQILILIGVIYLIMATHTVCGCCNFYKIMEGIQVMKEGLQRKNKEGFAGASINNGDSSNYSLGGNDALDTSAWSAPDLTMTNSAGVQNILNRPEQPVPLPEGEMAMFANTEFKPECCPNAYSTGSGCACMTVKQYNMLIERGGNNVPYSEY